MLIDTLRDEDISSFVSLGRSEGWIISEDEISKTKRRFAKLCFGAYDEDRFVGGITGYLHEKTGWIGNFIIEPDFRGRSIGRELFERLFDELRARKQTVYLHAALSAVAFYEKFGFRHIGSVGRFVLERSMAGRFHDMTMKYDSLANANEIMGRLDNMIFGEDRQVLLEDMQDSSSILLLSENLFCHSKTIGEHMIIGACEAKNILSKELKDMLQVLIGNGSSKSICVDIPMVNKQAVILYEDLGFQQTGECTIMVCGECMPVEYSSIYAFASLGSKG